MTLKYKQLVNNAVKNISNERTRDILGLRFGLNDGQRKTLEAIGQEYGITRERVRQVEEAAFSDLKKSDSINLFSPAFRNIDNFLNKEGKIVREERLLSSLTKTRHPHADRGALYFILTLGKPYKRFVESDKFHPLWSNSDEAVNQAQEAVKTLVNKLEDVNKPVSQNYLLKEVSLPRKAALSYLDATKQINQNSFGQFGLVKWPEISPRGAKDKAYIVLKEHGSPLHFREVADLINEANLGSSLAQAQTVHNELIKDPRFILVGRGTYALKEWGYHPGTVKDVIVKVLKENGTMARERILDEVLNTRMVKPNTVLINLQNKQYFDRNKEGEYFLVK